jgi:RNA polymerase sigma factor (sigma-70 family)
VLAFAPCGVSLMAEPESPSTSPTLLKLLAGPKNEAAWERFVRRYQPLIQRRCRTAGLNAEEADEVVARVQLRLVTALHNFHYDPARSFRGWLATVVRNVVRNYWRERKRHTDVRGSGDDAVQEQLENVAIPDPIARLADELDVTLQHDLRLVQRVLARVRERVEPATWQAYWLTAIEGRAGKEAARQLGLTVAQVFVYKGRVSRMLREEGRRLQSGGPTSEE